MERGNLVIYDPVTGKVWSQTGEAYGDVLPHEYPVGLPYIEIPFGTMVVKNLVSIDVTDPTNPIPVFEDVPTFLSPEERIAELENQLLLAKGVI